MALRVSLTNLYLLLVIIFVFICLICLQLLQPHHHSLRFKTAYVHLSAEYKPIATSCLSNGSLISTVIHPHEAFSTEVNQYKYRPNRDFAAVLSNASLHKYATGAAKSKGWHINYTQVGKHLDQSESQDATGPLRMYRYDHITQLCYRHYISLKYTPECGLDDQLELKYVKPLLIVAVQRSGTHYMWEMLQRLQIDVHHEGVGPDGAVSWLYAVNAHANHSGEVYEFGKGYAINNPEVLHKNRFRHIFHQVRHPLRVITTLFNRCSEFDTIWRWIHNLKGFQQIKPDQTPLRRAMLLYLLWNKHIEKYADIRYQSEVTSPRDVCLWAGFPASRCLLHYTAHHSNANITTVSKSSKESEAVAGEPDAQYYSYSAYSTNVGTVDTTNTANTANTVKPDNVALPRRLIQTAHTSSSSNAVDRNGNITVPINTMRVVTWSDLDIEDIALANELRVMCLEYGYSLDPTLTPQRDETKQFTA